MTRYAIPGLGIVDVMTELKVVPGPGGRGSRVVGTGKAWVRRLDNSFFRDIAGGLPRIETNLERGNDGILHFTNLELFAPALRLSGAGRRNRDGTFHIVARGRQSKYGTLRMTLDGRIERPRVDLLLDRQRDARVKDMRCCGADAAGSTTRRPAARSSARSPQRPDPAAKRRPATIAIPRSTSAAAPRAETCAPIPAASPAAGDRGGGLTATRFLAGRRAQRSRRI